MVNVVMVDDKISFLNELNQFITNILISKNLKFNIEYFSSFNDDFWNIINKKLENLLLFIDIEVPPDNGIDMARKIRSMDENAEILFITANDTQNYRYAVSSSSIKSFGFINKVNAQNDIKVKVDEFIDLIEKRNDIKIKENNTLIAINLEDVTYLEYNSKLRKTIIHTRNDKFKSYRSLTHFEQLLVCKSNKFIRTHKKCIVNVKKIKKVDLKNEEIIFYNDKKINLLSTKYKKDLEQKFTTN